MDFQRPVGTSCTGETTEDCQDTCHCQDPEKESPATTVRRHQIFITRDILDALKRPIPGQDEGENWIRHRILCCGRAREKWKGASTTWSLNEPSEKRARSAGCSASWRSWNRTTTERMGDLERDSPNEKCPISSLSG